MKMDKLDTSNYWPSSSPEKYILMLDAFLQFSQISNSFFLTCGAKAVVQWS